MTAKVSTARPKRCRAHKDCALDAGHPWPHRRKPTQAQPHGKIIAAAELTLPMPGVDMREQQDRQSPEMPSGPALYIWDFRLAMHLAPERDYPNLYLTYEERMTFAPSCLCGHRESGRGMVRKRSAPLHQICGACRIEASKLKGVIR